ncbi:uncharacterized protein LOC111862158, partial [Cryptotermes secundus]|uniref:uncharacterized protein LOC111862158 n=1 Tax=Cryptotermes secundus TaxID=105785 RepID=UPI000CD7ADFE
MWCGGGHLHRECPEKQNAASTPACCNCELKEEGSPIPPTFGAADTRGRNCRGGNRREHPKLRREGCSPRISLLLESPSRQRSVAAHHRSNDLRLSKFQWQSHQKPRNRASQSLYRNKKTGNTFTVLETRRSRCSTINIAR